MKKKYAITYHNELYSGEQIAAYCESLKAAEHWIKEAGNDYKHRYQIRKLPYKLKVKRRK